MKISDVNISAQPPLPVETTPVIHKPNLCSSCYCGQTLPASLQDCPCFCHPQDRMIMIAVAAPPADTAPTETDYRCNSVTCQLIGKHTKICLDSRKVDTIQPPADTTPQQERCVDCPAVGYLTDATRCAECPRRSVQPPADTVPNSELAEFQPAIDRARATMLRLASHTHCYPESSPTCAFLNEIDDARTLIYLHGRLRAMVQPPADTTDDPNDPEPGTNPIKVQPPADTREHVETATGKSAVACIKCGNTGWLNGPGQDGEACDCNEIVAPAEPVREWGVAFGTSDVLRTAGEYQARKIASQYVGNLHVRAVSRIAPIAAGPWQDAATSA